MPLGKLLAVLSHNHGQVAELRWLPAEGLVHQHVQRCGGNPLLGPHHVGNLHEVVVHDVGQVVGGEAVAFQQDGVGVDVLVLPLDVPQEGILEPGDSLHGNLEPDDVGLAGVKVGLNLLRGKVAAVAVVSGGHLVHGLDGADSVKTLGIAEAVVGLALFHQLLGVLLVQVEALGLDVGAVFAALFAALVPLNAQPGHGVVEVLDVFLSVAGAVGVLQPQDELAAIGTGKKIVEQGGAHPTDMLHPRRGGSVTNTNFHRKLLSKS